jgi:hypothetical protein
MITLSSETTWDSSILISFERLLSRFCSRFAGLPSRLTTCRIIGGDSLLLSHLKTARPPQEAAMMMQKQVAIHKLLTAKSLCPQYWPLIPVVRLDADIFIPKWLGQAAATQVVVLLLRAMLPSMGASRPML